MESSSRQQRILSTLRARQRVEVAELAEELGCSEMTIRRDLDALAELGAARRVRGGAVSLLTGEETPYAARRQIAGDAKRAIAAAVAEMIQDGETVVLDSGTTALEVANLLRGRRITAMPLCLHTASVLAAGPHARLLLPGGEVRPGERSFFGPLAERAFEQLRFDTMVLGACGVDVRHGATAHHVADASLKRAALDASLRIIAVADASKLGAVAFGRICPIGRIDLLVTDAAQEDERVRLLREAGLSVWSAEA